MKTYGPYTRKDGRKIVVLVAQDGTRSTKSYPKYVLEQKLGVTLAPDETVDHVDNNKLNNALNNWQVLSRAANARKARHLHPQKMFYFICPICARPAARATSKVKYNMRAGKAGPTCSKQCAGKMRA